MGIVRTAVCDGCQASVVMTRDVTLPGGWNWFLRHGTGLLELYCMPCSAADRPGGAVSSGTLAHELGIYRERLDELLGPDDLNEGRYVVIKGDEVISPFPDLDSALAIAHDRFGLGPFLVRKIERFETIHRI